MSAGVLYFNVGTRYLVRLGVSLHSLRSVYRGPVALVAEGELPAWIMPLLRDMDVEVRALPAQGVAARTMKASLWRASPFDTTLLIDADTVIRKDPTPLLEAVDRHGFVVTQFANWITTGRRMSKRIRSWQPVLSSAELAAALAFGPAVNTGVVGWRRDAPVLQAWEDLARQGWAAGCTRRLIDELACQVLLPRFPHLVVPETWNRSARHGLDPDPAIIHYHGDKHAGTRAPDRVWEQAYWRLRHRSSGYTDLGESHGDRALEQYLRAAVHTGVTVVTVVNRAYQHKLAANWPLWMKTPGLMEQQYLVLAVGDPDLGVLTGYRNVTVAAWNAHGDGRAGCLNAFVFGAAAHVQTPFWMKLDCDVRPRDGLFVWPAYSRYTLTGQRWGYTRVKGDPEARQHWLNALDEWWGGAPLFPPGLPLGRHRHRRIASFCAIERTDFTRRLARQCGTRLPVPSQDTTSWYAATRWHEPIQRVNMRKWLVP